MKRLAFIIFLLLGYESIWAAKAKDAKWLNSEDYDKQEDISPKHFSAYLGLGVMNWNPSAIGDGRYVSEVDPYFIKEAEVRYYDFYGLDGRLSYYTNQLLNYAGFNQPKDVVTEEEEVARSIAAHLNGPFFGKYRFTTTSRFLDFSGKATIKRSQYTALATGSGQVDYYDLDGSRTPLAVGDQITWQTTMQDVEFMMVTGRDRGAYSGYGVRWIRYQAPIELEVSGANSDILFMSEVQTLAFVYYIRMGFDISRHMWVEYDAPLVIGINRVKTGYFQNEAGPDLGSYSAMTWTGLALNYKTKRLTFRIGAELTVMVNGLGGLDLTLEKDLPTTVNEDGQPEEYIPAGSKVNVTGFIFEYIWGVTGYVSYQI